jgi:2-iminobutanoate/2-iminopropanoate deaminase
MRLSACLALAALAACSTPRTPVLTDRAPKAIGPYSHAIIDGDYVFVAGQGPIDPATGNYQPSDIQTEARRTLENLKAILEAAGTSFDKVVKTNVYLRDMKEFQAMNEVYAQYFKPPYPARTTIQAAALPRGIGIEIDVVARR